METNGHPSADAPPARSRLGLGVVVFGLILTIPVILAVAVFPLFQQEAFTSLDDVRPESIRSMRVQILVRPEIAAELDGRGDVGPYYAAGADFENLLAPLRSAEEVAEFTGGRGPLLGEYRILTDTNRRSTIRMYWSRDPNSPDEVSARLRFVVGGERGTKYEGGPAVDVIRAATAAAERGS